MPQFDIFVFFNQALWFFIVFWIFHIVTLKNLLVPIIKILKMRSKLFKYSQKIKEQQQNNLDNIKELDKPNKKKLCIYTALYSRAFAVITKKLLEDLKKKRRIKKKN